MCVALILAPRRLRLGWRYDLGALLGRHRQRMDAVCHAVQLADLSQRRPGH